MGSDSYINGDAEADSKPFSIRQFVVDTRRKDIFHCWPFPQKYLQICLKYGISNVLPPLEPCKQAIRTTTMNVAPKCCQQHEENVSFENKVIVPEKLIKDECNSYYDEFLSKAPCHGCLKSRPDNGCKHKDESNLSSDYTSNIITVPVIQQSNSLLKGSHLHVHRRTDIVSPDRLMRHKRRKHKGRLKKRSMSDILARAKPCILEDRYRIISDSINFYNVADESSLPMASVDGIKYNDDEASNDNLSSKKSRVLKISFDGCISKSWKFN